MIESFKALDSKSHDITKASTILFGAYLAGYWRRQAVSVPEKSKLGSVQPRATEKVAAADMRRS